MSRRKEQQEEGLSKRQARREEIRRKERQQRLLLMGGLVLVSLVIVGFVVAPMVSSAMNPAGDFQSITPQAYASTSGSAMGDPNAPVKVEVFEDFKCPACSSYALRVEPDVIKSLVETGQVYYVFYQFPFLDDNSQDKVSDRAANATECAAEQNQFWNFKNLVFTNQRGEFTIERFVAFADELGLDTAAFETCLRENRYQSKIDQDLAAGQAYGIGGTPAVIVNGKEVTPGRVPGFSEIQQAVAEALGAPAATPAP